MNAIEIIRKLALSDIDLYLDQDAKLKAKAPKGAITAEIAGLIKGNKDALVTYLQQLNNVSVEQNDAVKIPLVARGNNLLPVSFAQQRLWFIDSLQGGTPEYNMPMVFEAKGQLDTALVSAVFNTIIERHEVLRTVYVERSGETLQSIRAITDVDFKVNVVDLTHLHNDALDAQVKTLVERDVTQAFDLATDVMLRVSYLRKTKDSGVMVFNMHHIASDGWSMEVLTKEFFALYSAYSKGIDNPLPELEIQYADYAHWQRDHLEGEVLDSQLQYWQKQLDELPAVHSLPLDYARTANNQHHGAVVSKSLPANVAQAMLALAKTHKLTPFMLLHGALSLLLSRHSNNHDIVIGTPVANRLHAQLEPLIGFFVNTLVLRADTSHQNLSAYFAHIKQVHLDAQSNQDVPFEQLVERLNAPRNNAHSPLFQIMLTTNTDYGVSDDSQGAGFSLPGVDIQPYHSELMQAKFDLEVDLSISEQGIGLHWTYDTGLFTEQHITVLNDHLCRLFDGLTSTVAPTQVLDTLPLLSVDETKHLVNDLNDSQMDYPVDVCIHQLFEQKAKANPDSIAVSFAQKQLTYRQLNEKANQLAHYLVETHQVTPDTLIGLCVERSLEMVIGLFAILKSGGAYVPLDPTYPQERISYMLEDAQLKVVLTQSTVESVLVDFKETVVTLDGMADVDGTGRYDDYGVDDVKSGQNSSSLAYVIYTSGSTGNPKGVLIEHQSVVNLVYSQTQNYGFDSPVEGGGEVGLMLASYAFDAAVEQVFAMLLNGNTLVVPTREDLLSPDALLALISTHKVTHIDSTPSHLLSIIECLTYKSVKRVISGGEAMIPQLRDAIAGKVKLFNVYGPTETCVTSSVSTLADAIGKPIGNTEFYLLNEHLSLVPKGTVGELYIGGDGLARGYLNRPDLTQERFIDNPFVQQSQLGRSSRLYRTGDLVRYLADGNVEFVGRADDQVKIRGFRIELGEVEATIAQLQAVDSALVLAKSLAGSMQLVGYVKAKAVLSEQARSEWVKDILDELKVQLPQYMVPSFVVVVEQWPVTPSGKIDRKALPEPDGNALVEDYIAPNTQTEQVLVEIWADLLGLAADSISSTANFFELGGHSLLSVRLVAEIRNRLTVEVAIQSIFDHATVQGLAAVIEKGSQALLRPPLVAIERDSDEVVVSFAQQRLWFIDNLQGGSSEYNMPMVFEVNGQLDMTLVLAVFNTIIERHAVLRTVYLERDGQTLQHIRKMQDINFEIATKRLSHLTGETLDTEIKTQVEADITKAFNLASDMMLRVTYLSKTADSGVMILNMHHIASDGWSMEVLTNEFFALYNAYSQGLANPLPALKVQYVDYAYWQRDYLAGEVLESQLAYWQNRLDELPAVHSLPLDYSRPSIKRHEGAMVTGQLPGELAKGLLNLAQSHNLTPFMLLHGALSLLLSKHSNSHDIVVGTPVANRLQAEVEPLIGFFVNTLVLRADTRHKTLTDYLAHIREVHLEAQSNQDVPFEQLVERLKAPRSTAHSPLFQVMLTTDSDFGLNADSQGQTATLPGVEFKAFQSDVIQAKFDLNVALSISEQGLGLNWTYDTSLFTAEHIEQLNTHLCRLLERLAQSQTQSVDNLDALSILSRDEVEYLIYDLNDTALDYPSDACIHQLFERQAELNPDNIAVLFENQSLTYQQLNEKANQLAHYLKEQHHITADSLVGVCVERSLEMVIGILAILKAGGAYVPLDPSYPQDRLSYMLEDASVNVVFSQTQLQGVLAGFNGTILTLNELAQSDNHWSSHYASSNLSLSQTDLSSDNLAYVIYTSGSTGKPKGVMIEHQNTVAMLAWALEAFDKQELSVVLASTSLNFDLSVYELFLPLSAGTSLRVVRNVLDLVSSEHVDDITLVNTVPSAMDALLKMKAVPSQVKVINLAGEALRGSLVNGIIAQYPDVSVCNLYGPSEDTTYSTYARFDQAIDSTPSIGRVISNSIALILDEAQQLVPYGVAGELYLGGDGISRGYLNRPELTQERYIDNPYYDADKANSVARLYRTGDLVRYLADGNMDYIGRIDHQVKIRGFRIELGEVETQLGRLESIDSALVMAKDLSGTAQLIGYIKPSESIDEKATVDFIELVKQQLSQTLPEYMVPSIIMVVKQWPLTPNGKMDRKALPEPDGSALQGEYVAPTSDTEQVLVDIWAGLLNLDPQSISTEANFFDLGGHSLLSIRLVSEVRAKCDVEISVQSIFDNATLKSLAATIEQTTQTVVRPPLTAIERDTDKVAVSFAQQRLWFIDNLQGATPEYNMPMVFEVEGQLDLALVTRVFSTIVERHGILRTVYLEQDGQTLQHIRPMSAINFDIGVKDLSHLSGDEQDKALHSIVAADINGAFNLATDTMLRVCYISKNPQSGVMILNMHHIASDGWSMEVLTKEFFALYAAYSQQQSNPLPDLAVQYADFAHWQRDYLEGEVLESQLKFWQKQLDELPGVHSLGLDFPRPAIKQHQGALVTGQLPAAVGKGLLSVAKAHKVTGFMLLHGALSLLLSRHSNSHDIVIGTPVANRLQAELEPLIGFFVNTLVLRADTSHATLADYFAHIRQVHLDAQSNQDVPFEQLVERLNVPRNTAHSPLFQIMLTTNTDYGLSDEAKQTQTSLPGVDIKSYESDVVHAKFDLNVDLSISEQGVGLNWTYDTSLFTEQHIERLNTHLCSLLQGLAQGQADQPLAALPMLSEAETEHLVYGLNDSVQDYPRESCMHEIIEQHAQNNPENVAVAFKDESLTYKQLNEKANQLAHYLKDNHQITPDTLVGICVERSLELVIGILAVLKAGGAFVPLDPSYPQERLNYMLEDAALDVVLHQSQTEKVLTGFNGTLLALDDLSQNSHWCDSYPQTNLGCASIGLTSANLVYVIYTSGTTGKPKGVMVEHQGLINTILDNASQAELTSDSVFYQATSIGFDAACMVIFAALTSSSKLVLSSTIDYQAELAGVNNITHLMMTPSMLSLVEPDELHSLNCVIAGGEACDRQLALKWSKQVAFFNAYGPTEISICSSMSRFVADESINIGCPNANVQYLILDGQRQLAPKGVVGELYIGGEGITRGYLNKPQLTAQSFIDNPFYDEQKANSSSRLYRTGDLVRYLPSGNVEFIGRIDDQVKIRGFRIELGEVETQLGQLELVESALVLVKELAGDKQLVGYVKPAAQSNQQDQASFVSNIKTKLAQTLPEYMVPNAIVVIAQWPVTPNGKVDKKALPAPDSNTLHDEYVAPVGAIEQTLVEIWASLFNQSPESISTASNFFDLGGHSLLSIRLVSEIRKRCEVEISLQSIFDHATVQALAGVIEQSSKASMRPALTAVKRDSDTAKVSFAQQRLSFIDSLQGGTPEYNMPMAFEVKGQLDLALVTQVFNTIIERHATIRTVYLEQDGQTLQHIRPVADVNFDITVKDLSDLSGQALSAQLKTLIQSDITQAFNLASDLMLRVSFYHKTADTGVMILNMHHIASDGWSMEVLMKEFHTLYGAYSNGQGNPLPPLDIQYVDYAYWQRDYLEGEVLDSQLDYWVGQLDELPAVHSLPLDYPRPSLKQHQGAVVSSQLPAAIAQGLLGVAKAHNLTPFMLLHGALSLLLSKHSNSHDIVIGTPVANRLQAELEPLIGFFVNTLVLRADTSHAKLSDYFAHVKNVHLGAQSNQDVPFEQLVERLKAPRSTAHSPLFQIMLTTNTDFGLNGTKGSALTLPGVEIQAFESDVIQAKFDLEIALNISEQGVGLDWTYDTSLFSSQHIEQLNTHMCRLLEGLALSQAQQVEHVAELSVLSSAEVEHLLYELNDNAIDYPADACMHQLFEQQVQQRPNNVAVSFEDKSLSYIQLNEKANQLAHYLIDNHQITPDTLVGVCVERSLEMVIGIMAILKAGGAYVPLDPSYPKDRLSYMLENGDLTVVLSQTSVQQVLAEFEGTILTLDGMAAEDNHRYSAYANSNIELSQTGLTNANLAYVIYTSGSTGKPKGVMIEHRNTVAMLGWGVKAYQQDELAVVLASTSLNFDISIYELFLPLSIGTRLRIVKNVLDLVSSEHVDDITLINTVPSAMDALLKTQVLPSKVKTINLAGEALRSSLVNGILAAYPEVSVCNLYGPSEDTTYSTYARFEQQIDRVPHIGQVISNSMGLVLDENQQLVPYGVAGELYLGGDGISRGYLNRDDLTIERYIDNPFYDADNAKSVKRLYRTGDLVRYLPDGNFDYLGRIDHQVKIRGFRIELGEVEAQLGQVDSVDSALVMAQEIAGMQELVGYILPTEKIDEQQVADYIAAVKDQLSKTLPQYMVPGVLMVIEQWPLTPNGKMDRKALPAPDGSALSGEYVAAVTQTEKTLVDIWSSVLNIEATAISTTANFFDLGGHSLLSVKLLSLIHTHFAKACDLSQLFSQTTVQAQAIMLDQIDTRLNNTPLLTKVTTLDAPTQGIILIPGVASTARDFADILKHLPQSDAQDTEIGILRHKGLIAGEPFFDTIEENVSAFAQELENIPVKTLTLVGHSYGGALALSLSNLLTERGYQIRLVMLDSYFQQDKLDVFEDETQKAQPSIESQDIPAYLKDLYKHQLGLFTAYIPQMDSSVATTMVFAKQTPFEQQQYINYLDQQLSGTPIAYTSVEGEHFSMLQGNSAEVISAIIKNKGNS